MPDPLLVGLDVHHKTHSVCVMNVMGAIIDNKLTVPNTPAGAEALAGYLHALASRGGYDAFHIAAEATGWYWWHFFRALSSDPRLKQRPLALYPLNPRLVAKLKQTYSDDDKTDPGDAFVVAPDQIGGCAWGGISLTPSATTRTICVSVC